METAYIALQDLLYAHLRDLMFATEALAVASLGLVVGLLLRPHLQRLAWPLGAAAFGLFLAIVPYGSARADVFDTLSADAKDKGGKLLLLVGIGMGLFSAYRLIWGDHRAGWKALGLCVVGLIIGFMTTGGQIIAYAQHLAGSGF